MAFSNAEQIRKKRGWLQELKLASGCVDCGYAEHACALDFDHVRGEKKFNLGSIATNGWDKIKAEVEKCEVVCANCHRVRTMRRREENRV